MLKTSTTCVLRSFFKNVFLYLVYMYVCFLNDGPYKCALRSLHRNLVDTNASDLSSSEESAHLAVIHLINVHWA
jgi:hypothetical protein